MQVKLSDMKLGETGTIRSVKTENLHDMRILEMGFVQGEKITVTGFAPLGDPMEVRILDYSVSLRKSDSENILIQTGQQA